MRKLLASLLSVLLLISCISVCGAETSSISAELDVQDFSVIVQGNGLTPLAVVSVIAVEEGEQPLQAAETLTAVYVGQAAVNADGVLRTAIGLSPSCASGSYEVCVVDAASGMIYRSNVFRYTQPEAMETALARVNSASVAELAGVLTQYWEELLLDMTEYDLLGSRQQDVAELLAAQRPASGFAAAYDLHRAFGRSIVAVALAGAEQPEELLYKYARYFDIDLNVLDGCTAAERAYAMAVMTQENYASAEEVEEKYPEAVFAGKAAQAATAGQLQQCFLTDYRTELSLDLSEYNRLTNPAQVFSALLTEDFSGYADAREKFYAAVRTQADREGSGTNGGGSPSSGSGGRGSSGNSGGGAPMLSTNNGIDTTPLEPPVYQDLADVAWAMDAIEYLTEKGIVSGDGDGNFRPNDTVTRAEFIKMVALAFEIGDSSISTDFADVADTDWYAGYVAAGYDAGIINGISETWFGANENITREDLAVMCVRAVEYDGMELAAGAAAVPTDEDTISDYAREAVLMLYSAGIVNGNPDGSFLPQANATRAEAAKIIAGLMQTREGN